MEPGPGTEAPSDEPLLLLEGWMLLVILYPEAMAEIARVPPANDAT